GQWQRLGIARARYRDAEILIVDEPTAALDAKEEARVFAQIRELAAAGQTGVGGDWFDVIPVSGTRVALVVGDVVGHGLHAAATMGRLRATVRTLADIDLPPDELLTHLDDVVIRMRGESEEEDAQEAGGAGEGRPMETGATCLSA
ncbi:SpoIIE family protein phosphatase, partial [Vibrio vulnificus]|nr:SpoIIE family protein phosphatase [Vibrio vulnificus]